MKKKSIRLLLLVLTQLPYLPAKAQQPAYLDDSQPLETRVEDALSRLTLEEKIGLIHAQSKFSSAGVERLGIPEVWCTDGPTAYGPKYCGTSGIRPDGPTTRAQPFRR